MLRTGEQQQQDTCAPRPSILQCSPRRPQSDAGALTVSSFSTCIWTMLECWGWKSTET